jgi:hypothetical protein
VEYCVIVPDPIRDEIRLALSLSDDAEDNLYELLENALAYGHEETCFRLAAPSPTYVYKLSFFHPCLNDGRVLLTFWLTYGARDDGLYVMQWGSQECDENGLPI